MGVDPDFSGYATRSNILCTDGRTILPDAFKHMDGVQVPLVWNHGHNDPTNVLGHAILEARNGDIYCHAFFNKSDKAQAAKAAVQHGDIDSMSIWANQLREQAKRVAHGVIREVSLVFARANRGAVIDNVNLAHSNDPLDDEYLDDEAIIYSGSKLELTHSDERNNMAGMTNQELFDSLTSEQQELFHSMITAALEEGSSDGEIEHADDEDLTVQDVIDGMSKEQKDVLYFMVGQALENKGGDSAKHADDTEGNRMGFNVFEQGSAGETGGSVLSHSEKKQVAQTIFDQLQKGVGSGMLSHAVNAYIDGTEGNQLMHGVRDIEILFPDAKNVAETPEFIKRQSEWVTKVLSGTRHLPFTRIKSQTANLTVEEARAKGYVKGNFKKEEFFRVAKRETGPQTIYKKQQLDRDDILDITDFDVVIWIKSEMRLMLNEEIARAILIGDGRSAGDEDRINPEKIRPIATDDDLFVTTINLNLNDANSSAEEIIDAAIRHRRYYKGTGKPTYYTSDDVLSDMLLIKDGMGRRIYNSIEDLKSALRVEDIVPVELFSTVPDLVGIYVNLTDYAVGTDKGGEVSMFDDFDIDFNKYKYLIETRLSGCLTKAKSALVFRKVAGSSVLVDPVAPGFNAGTHAVTVATTTGITYKNKATGATLVTGTPFVLGVDDELTVIAVPNAGYHFATSANDEFLFNYTGRQA